MGVQIAFCVGQPQAEEGARQGGDGRKVLDNDAPAAPRATVRHHVNKLANNPRRPAVANMLRRLPHCIGNVQGVATPLQFVNFNVPLWGGTYSEIAAKSNSVLY